MTVTLRLHYYSRVFSGLCMREVNEWSFFHVCSNEKVLKEPQIHAQLSAFRW